MAAPRKVTHFVEEEAEGWSPFASLSYAELSILLLPGCLAGDGCTIEEIEKIQHQLERDEGLLSGRLVVRWA